MTYKPHAIIPLDQSLQLGVENTQTNEPDYIHPYAVEIEQYLYPSTVYSNTGPIQYHPFDSTKATYVDTEEALAEMLAELKQAKEIAVDLEHHDYRTYIGLVSLMQISTRNRDWIVDTLKPWRRRLECLNEVFTDPNILKVFHGATSDIVWLQRDLGLYVVGLFDTYHAARALRYQGASLAFLLMKFCSFEAQKQYQMADWRIRYVLLPKHIVSLLTLIGQFLKSCLIMHDLIPTFFSTYTIVCETSSYHLQHQTRTL